MVRDFSQQVKERLFRQIDAVNNDTFCFLTDRVGDLISKFGYWIGLLNIEDYTNRISVYHRKILDMNNTTKSQIEEIFSNVYAIDLEFADKIRVLADKQEERTSKINVLAEMINPSFSIAPAAQIKEKCRDINKKIKAADKQIAASYNAELKYAEKRAAWESVKGAGSNILSLAGEICGFTAEVASGKFVSAATSGWGIINSVFAVGWDLAALGALGIGIGVGASYGKGKNEVEEQLLGAAEDFTTKTGLTDAIDTYGGYWKWLGGVSGTIDNAVAVYDVYKGASSIVDTVSDGIKGKLNWIEQGFGEAGVDVTVTKKGIKFVDIPDRLKNTDGSLSKKELMELNRIYKKAKTRGSIYSNIKTAFNYGEAAFNKDKSVGEELFKNSTVGGFLTKTYDTGEDVLDSVIIDVY